MQTFEGCCSCSNSVRCLHKELLAVGHIVECSLLISEENACFKDTSRILKRCSSSVEQYHLRNVSIFGMTSSGSSFSMLISHPSKPWYAAMAASCLAHCSADAADANSWQQESFPASHSVMNVPSTCNHQTSMQKMALPTSVWDICM